MRRFGAKLKSLNDCRNVAAISLFVKEQGCGHLRRIPGSWAGHGPGIRQDMEHTSPSWREIKNELERAANDLLHFIAPVSTWPCDVKEPHEVEQAISAIAEKHARIDVLVNNAGIMLVAPLDAMVKGDFEEAMQIHFWGPLPCHNGGIALPTTKYRKPNREHLVHRRPGCGSSYGAVLRKQVCLGGLFRCASRGSR